VFNKVSTEKFNISCPGIFGTLNGEYHAVLIYLYGTTGQYMSIPFSGNESTHHQALTTQTHIHT